MLDLMIDFVLADPCRLTSLGAAFGRVGDFPLVAGLVGSAATTAVCRLEANLGDVFPDYLSPWMPESEPGFCLATLMPALVPRAVRTGRANERQFGI